MCTTGVDAARGKAAPRRSSPPGGRLRSARHDVLGPLGTVGLGPHMLHQIGFLASTALIAGAAGAAVFGCSASSPPLAPTMPPSCTSTVAPPARKSSPSNA